MPCNDKCDRFKAKKPFGIGRYESGQSRCTICAIYINYAGRFCPCCMAKLRKKPRTLKYKEQLRERGGRIEYGVEMK
jgi:hypothetical protein